MVADTGAVMGAAEDHELHALLVAIRARRPVASTRAVEAPERSLADPDRMARLFADRPEALGESMRVAEACRLDLTIPTRVPELDEEAEAPARRLSRLCARRLAERRLRGFFRSPEY